MPDWKYHPAASATAQPHDHSTSADGDAMAAQDVDLWKRHGARPERYVSNDLRLTVAIDEHGCGVYRHQGAGYPSIRVCYAGDGLQPAEVIARLDNITPTPDDIAAWESAIKQAVAARAIII